VSATPCVTLRAMRGSIVLLGPQRPTQNLSQALATVPGDGPVVAITAGWRHDEGEIEALNRAIGPGAVHLPIYRWFDEAMAAAPAVAAAWRDRQAKIMELKALHRMRLHPAIEALRQVLDRVAAGSEIARPQVQWSLDHLRDLDRQFLDHSGVLQRQHPETLRPWELPEVAPYHQRITERLKGARAILVAGGHVAVLRNRLEFFGLKPQLAHAIGAGTSVVAWSAGAMCLTERIVLFYDDPPDGSGHPELLDSGFEMVKSVVLFPHCRERLRLDDGHRVSLLATRFAPQACIGLENGAWLEQSGDRWTNRGTPGTAVRLWPDGQVRPLPASNGPAS
jgi:hypothetical protein